VRIAVLNGPSLNLLGSRAPELYGRATLGDIEKRLRVVAGEIGAEVEFAQHNGEGELIDRIHAMRGKADGVLINAGAYTHTSLAIRDALAAVDVPFVEVHLTNIFARDPEGLSSLPSPGPTPVLCGFGALGYELALRGLVAKLAAQSA
jgi:3-dehydroquinate dehydratase II